MTYPCSRKSSTPSGTIKAMGVIFISNQKDAFALQNFFLSEFGRADIMR